MSLALGLADPVHDSQRLFRDLLHAFAHPGRVVGLRRPPPALAPLGVAATATLLTLVDRDTPLWLSPCLASPDVIGALRFHTGAPLVEERTRAAFAVDRAGSGPLLAGLPVGDDRFPDRAATAIVEVPDLRGGPPTTWRGPGIAAPVAVGIGGLSAGFWTEWTGNRALFPGGVDVLFTAGREVVALPRSIDVET